MVMMVLASLACVPGQGVADEPEVNEAAVRQRVAGELRCLDAAKGRLDEAVRLLREAYVQMGSSGGDRVRRDAARAAESLEQRIRTLSKDLQRCMAEAPQPRQVVYRDAPADPTARAVAEENPATNVVDRNRRLGPYLAVEVGEQVDGAGRVPDGAIRDAVTGIARPLRTCYERLVARSVLERGRLTLLFRVDARGRVVRTRVEEGGLGGPAFARCVAYQSRRHLRVSTPPTGGHADYSYTLQFGPEQP
jgi:hypothetical protein